MKQALHILRKDMRYLRWEIAAMLGVSVLFVALQPVALEQVLRWSRLPTWPRWDPLGLLLTGTGLYLAVRAVQAEPLPGVDRFWLTRPYRRESLLGAKLAFILLFAGLPMLAAEAAALARGGLMLPMTWDHLLSSGTTTFLLLLLPAAAAAALTPNLRTLVLSGVLLAGVYFSVTTNGGSLVPASDGIVFGWIRSTILTAALASGAGAVLGIQYFRRDAGLSFKVTAALSAASLLMVVSLPVSASMALQTAVAGNQIEASRVTLHAEAGPRTLSPRADRPSLVEFDIPLRVDGLPADSVLDVHRIELALQGPDEPRRPEAVQLAKTGINRIEARVWFRNEDLEALAGAPTTLRVVLAASVLAHPRELQVAIGGSYTEIAPGGPVCRREPGIRGVRDTEPVDDLRCRTPLSSAWHIAKGEWNDPVWPGYSPFPRAFGVSRLYDLPQGRMPRSLPMLTLLVREPIGHFYREFEIPIDLEDFRL